MNYKWLTNIAKISDDHTSIIVRNSFNQKIEPNTLPKKLINLTFGISFNQQIEPENLTTLTFG